MTLLFIPALNSETRKAAMKTAFDTIALEAIYPSNIVRKAAIHMLLSAAQGKDVQTREILIEAMKKVCK